MISLLQSKIDFFKTKICLIPLFTYKLKIIVGRLLSKDLGVLSAK